MAKRQDLFEDSFLIKIVHYRGELILDNNNIKEKVVEIIKKYSNKEIFNNNIMEMSFEDGIVNSLEFISIIVDLESEFGIEFDDEMLLISSYEGIEQLIDYISSKIIE